MVASAWKMYNDLLNERPDVVRVLAEPNWPVHVSDRKSRYTFAPLLAFHDNKLLASFDPSRLGAHPAMKGGRSARIPALTAVQREALDVVSAVAQKNSKPVDTKPGDMVFINNWALVHARSAYTDPAEETGTCDTTPNTRRHLVRLWLRNAELGWKVPESLRAPWESAFGYTDEGYVSGDYQAIAAQLKYAVVPELDYTPPKYTTGSAAFAIDESDSDEYDSDEYEDDNEKNMLI
ncbi:taurine catabolism dioxygenase family protein [Niveomyces insectorum RCEF 264]|uniref:Taurine catabolism dioxygenase family protein n=1 Tax=Niveomyces insectorum RCEF 264 TaxID=1081102 RepID=A0A162J9F1_9HYPO|nr:taurine catabolism dioxygenase family protein [Niveomyces insectorum RCEF 264]